MKPLKLIDTLRTICYPPPEPQRAPENVQKEIDSLHDSIKVWAEAGHFREQYRYPNRDFGPSDTDQLTREMLILGFGIRRFGENIEFQWDVLGEKPEYATKFHAMAKRNFLGRVLDEFDDVMPEVNLDSIEVYNMDSIQVYNLGSIEVCNLEHLTPSDLAMCASFLEEIGFLPTVKFKHHTIELFWKD